MNVTLLHENTKNTINEHVFADLQLNKLLTPNAVNVLRYPCDEKVIRLRQGFFSALDHEDFFVAVTALRAALTDLDQCSRVLRMSNTEMERPFLWYQTASRYIAACRAFSALRGYCELADDACDTFESEEQTALADRLTEATQKIRSALDGISTFELSVASHTWESFLSETESVSVQREKLCAMAEELGYSVSDDRKRTVQPDWTLSDSFCTLFADELSEINGIIGEFDIRFEEYTPLIRELDFYLEMHALSGRAKENGIAVCFPEVAGEPRYEAHDACDPSLLVKECDTPVPNDIDFTKEQSFWFLTGANGGGKTTYLRCVGINAVFFLGGCGIFAQRAKIFPLKNVCTHFPQDERFTDTGRFDEEVRRVVSLCKGADESSLLLFNETFGGTDDVRGTDEAVKTATELCSRGAFGLFVTHFHQVADKGFNMLNAPADENDGTRTYKIYKSGGNRSSYAEDILKKYALDELSLSKRRI